LSPEDPPPHRRRHPAPRPLPRRHPTGSTKSDRKLTATDRKLTATDKKLTTTDAAALAGVTPSTWRAWRAHGRPRPEPAPDPDGWFELRQPWWWTSTVSAWLERRRQAADEDNPGYPTTP
jgi:hypothetical protein